MIDGRDEPQVDGSRRTRCAWAADAEETKGTQQRVNRCCSQTSLDRLDFALFLSLSSLYTGSSRHRVARLSTLFHRYSRLPLSIFLPISLSFFLSLSLVFLTPPPHPSVSSLRFPLVAPPHRLHLSLFLRLSFSFCGI